MPELPETETIARDLDATVRGATITAVEVLRRDVLRGTAIRKDGAPLLGATITVVSRRAKSIVIHLGRAVTAPAPRAGGVAVAPPGAADPAGLVSAVWLVATPRFTGAWLIADAPAEHPYACLRLTLSDGRLLQYVDVRRLGTVAVLDAAAYADWDAALGPEPLDPALTAERFSGILRGTRRAVKTVLMDQKRLAGVGNIYANEALWRAGVRPARRASALTRAEATRLFTELRDVLQESIALRGTTFRDFQDAYGRRGGFAERLQVYGRGGEACRRCGATLQETHALEGRATVWCRACQR